MKNYLVRCQLKHTFLIIWLQDQMLPSIFTSPETPKIAVFHIFTMRQAYMASMELLMSSSSFSSLGISTTEIFLIMCWDGTNTGKNFHHCTFSCHHMHEIHQQIPTPSHFASKFWKTEAYVQSIQRGLLTKRHCAWKV